MRNILSIPLFFLVSNFKHFLSTKSFVSIVSNKNSGGSLFSAIDSAESV